MKEAMVFWFTGLSGSGKTTIAQQAAQSLSQEGRDVKVFDGDVIRKELHSHLGFTPGDIRENNKKIAELCLENESKYDYIFVPIISPFKDNRQYARQALKGSIYVVYCKVSLKEVIKRDPKGLYKKALDGKIENFIGMDNKVPYEAPEDADLILDTEHENIDSCVNKMILFVKSKEKADA